MSDESDEYQSDSDASEFNEIDENEESLSDSESDQTESNEDCSENDEYASLFSSESENSQNSSLTDSDTSISSCEDESISQPNKILKELINRQIKDVPPNWRLGTSDMDRICSYIDTSIFDKKKCCLWKGYITNINNANKGTYVNFYFNGKKKALHRLLYSNFVAPLDHDQYLKSKCENKGICCNVRHFAKYRYSKKTNNSNTIRKSSPPVEKKLDIRTNDVNGDEYVVIDFGD